MKILAIGDFHGKISSGLKKKIKKLSFDIVLCTGDLAKTDKIRDLVFKYWRDLDNQRLADIIGENKVNKIYNEGAEAMQPVLDYLDSLNKPVYIVYGNGDFVRRGFRDIGVPYLNERVKKKKNLKLCHNRLLKLKDYNLIAFSGYRFVSRKNYTSKHIGKKNIPWDNRLKRVFSRTINHKKTIFLVHDPPYKTLDLVKLRKSPMYGKHIGDEFFRKYILKCKPLLCVCGHMHENQGRFMLGKTTVVNAGPAFSGKAAYIELEEKKIKKIRFLK